MSLQLDVGVARDVTRSHCEQVSKPCSCLFVPLVRARLCMVHCSVLCQQCKGRMLWVMSWARRVGWEIHGREQ